MRPFLEGEKGSRQGGSMMSVVDNTMNSGMAAREAEGSGWRLEVEDDQRKLG
jgi:hypothetical protein